MKNFTPGNLPSGLRLVAIDLDGTLLNQRRELPSEARQVFAQARRAGLQISFVTGRNGCSVRQLARILHPSGPHASSGGAMVFGNGGRPVYTHAVIQRADIRKIVLVCRSRRLSIFLQSPNQILMETGEHHLAFNPQIFAPCPITPCQDILADLKFKPLKFTIYGEPELLVDAVQDLENCNGCFHVTSTSENDIEITPFGVNKGSAIKKISEVTGVPLQNILAIGDSPNDISMFKEAGFAVAMENAHPDAKQAARLIAPSNEQAGVLWAIQNLALSSTSVL